MKQELISVIKALGCEVVQDSYNNDGSTCGHIVVSNPGNNVFVKIGFYENSYEDGYIDSVKVVTPRPTQIIEYV